MPDRLKTVALWLIVVFAALIMYKYFNAAKAPQELPYTEFLLKVESGLVEKVTLMDRQIQGSFKAGRGAGTASGERFTSYAPDDKDLVPLLRKNEVKITAKPADGGLWLTILISWGPILLLAVLWLFFMRQMQGAGSAAMSFGKSRAKLVAPNQSKVTFQDVAGVDEAKEELQEIIEFLKDPAKFQRLGGRIPKGVLLLGPPGTGKTLLAKAVAGEAGVPFFSISGSDFVEMFVGVGASRVRDLFEQAKKSAPCIIFIDEIDAVGRHRGAGLGGGHDEREQTLNQLLVEMDGFAANTGVILCAATNRPDVLDPALLRPGRFDRQIVVDRPDLKGREEILRVHTRSVSLDKHCDLNEIARRTPGFSGADLANLVNEAALLAARRNKKAVSTEELEEAIERVMAGPERKSRVISEREKKIIAFHECGHALVGKLIEDADPVHKISIIPRGPSALGYTLSMPSEDRFLATRNELTARLAMALGGRAAEAITFDEVSTGASNDLERATELAHKMVCEFGMSRKMGNVTYGRKEGQVFLGRDIVKEKNYSEQTAQEIDAEVRDIVEAAYKRAERLLKDHRHVLAKVSAKLLETEVMEGWEMDAILKTLGIKVAHPSPLPMGTEPAAPPPAKEREPRPAPAHAPVARRSKPATA